MDNKDEEVEFERQRFTLLSRLERMLELPMNLLAFVWLVLTVVELVWGLDGFLRHTVDIIWVLFWINFLVEFTVAPHKRSYLVRNWLTLFALIIPGIRIFRVVRFLRYARFMKGSALVRILSSINRGMGALSRSLGRRGFPYVIGLSVMVASLGAAGMMVFEKEGKYFQDYGSALWWSFMMITTMGTDEFPKTSEGRFMALLLAFYGFTIFGYVTASVATFFIDRDAMGKSNPPPEGEELLLLRREVQELKEVLRREPPMH